LRIYTSYTKTCFFLGVTCYFSRITYFWSIVLFRCNDFNMELVGGSFLTNTNKEILYYVYVTRMHVCYRKGSQCRIHGSISSNIYNVYIHQLSIVLPSKSRLVQLRIYTCYTKTCFFLGVTCYFSRITYFWSIVLLLQIWQER
jgi:hypothetical protein